MNQSLEQIKNYYDQAVIGKLKGFVEGNARVERAWETIEQWSPPKSPQRILEVGCGVGDISWRMSRFWETSEVVGVDISSKSIEIAEKLFGHSRLSFSKIEGTLTKDMLSGTFDLIILMDVYEHIPPESRTSLHGALKALSSDEGRIILTIPTPRLQNWIRKYKPENLQPIDEDISLERIQELAQAVEKEILLFQDIGAWTLGDYAHIVLGNRREWDKNPDQRYRVKKKSLQNQNNISLKTQLKNKLLSKLGVKRKKHSSSLVLPRWERLALVHNKLGFEAYPSK